MSNLEFVRDMLARANMRYTITVTDDRAVITVNGSRAGHPFTSNPVEFTFDGAGKLLNVEGN